MSIVASLIGFTILIVVHELGHYFAARAVGLRADLISIGFGPSMISWRGRYTEYRLAVFPIGGYVRFPSSGDLSISKRAIQDDGLRHLSHWDRFLVVSSGPLANVCLAIVVYAGLFVSNSAVVCQFSKTDANHLGAVTKSGKMIGVQSGDFVVAVNGVPTSSFKAVLEALSQSSKSAQLTLSRSPEHLAPKFVGRPSKLNGMREYWPIPSAKASVVEIVLPDREAMQRFAASVQPTVVRWGSDSKLDALFHGVRESLWVLRAMGVLLDKWLDGTAQPEVSSVIGMTKLSAESYERGWFWFLSLLALFSMNLAVLNCLPLPGLDGGRLCLDVLEFVSGKALPSKLLFWVHGVGMVFILVFIVVVMASESLDLLR